MSAPHEQPMMRTLRRQRAGRGVVSLLLAVSVMANGFMLLQMLSMKERIQEQNETIALMKKTNEQLRQSPDHKTAAAPKPPLPQTAAPATVAESSPPNSDCWIKDGEVYRDCAPPSQSRDY